MVKVADINKVSPIIQDMRKILKSDNRVLSRLHRRVFLSKITQEHVDIEVSFYLECNNRDMYLALR